MKTNLKVLTGAFFLLISLAFTARHTNQLPSAGASDKMVVSGTGDAGQRYQMRQNLVSFGDDFWIDDSQGQHKFKVNGKMVTVRQTLDFEDLQGKTIVKIQEKMLRVTDAIAIEDGAGNKAAEVKKAIISPVRDKYTVKIANGPDMEVKGNIVDHEYTIENGRQKIAEVSKKWFKIADSYGVEINAGQNDVLILAISVAIDSMSHPAK